MKPFRLAKVLHVRRQARAQRRGELMTALADQQSLRNQEAELRAQRRRQVQRLSELNQTGPLDVESTARRRFHTGRLDIQLMVTAEQLAQMEQRIEHLRQALIEADRDMKTLERLEAEHIARERRETERREERELTDQWQSAQLGR